jgi:hypothetical protein
MEPSRTRLASCVQPESQIFNLTKPKEIDLMMIQSFFAKKLTPLPAHLHDTNIIIAATLFLGRRKQFELGLLDNAFYACYIRRPMGDTILASLPQNVDVLQSPGSSPTYFNLSWSTKTKSTSHPSNFKNLRRTFGSRRKLPVLPIVHHGFFSLGPRYLLKHVHWHCSLR